MSSWKRSNVLRPHPGKPSVRTWRSTTRASARRRGMRHELERAYVADRGHVVAAGRHDHRERFDEDALSWGLLVAVGPGGFSGGACDAGGTSSSTVRQWLVSSLSLLSGFECVPGGRLTAASLRA